MQNKPVGLNDKLVMHMKYMTERQSQLAQNISHIDTPGYKARDLKKIDFNAMVSEASGSKLAMTATSAKHLNGSLGGANAGIFSTIDDRNTFERSPNGNNVVLEDQMAKISDTAAQFQLSSSMLRKFTQLYRTAIGNRQ